MPFSFIIYTKELPAMFVTVINDCKSENDIARQETRLMSLFKVPISFVGVSSDFSVNATLEAAGNLVDVLDAIEDRTGVILLNVAPRGEQKKDGYNGTPFCYFTYKNVTIISTVRGQSLSIIKKLGLIDHVNLVSVDDAVAFAHHVGLLSKEQADYIPTSQFRSFDFTPRLAYWLHLGMAVPFTKTPLDIIEDINPCVWYVDAFGNCKTTILPTDISAKFGETVKTNVGEFIYYPRLKDLSKGETALYVGSSGIGSRRFLELATQMQPGSAAKTLGITVGQEITIAA
jgi:hypothetical protein